MGRRVEYDNTGDMGRAWGMLKVRTFDNEDGIEITAVAGEGFDEEAGEGIDIVLNPDQMLHLRDLIDAEFRQVLRVPSVIREVE